MTFPLNNESSIVIKVTNFLNNLSPLCSNLSRIEGKTRAMASKILQLLSSCSIGHSDAASLPQNSKALYFYVTKMVLTHQVKNIAFQLT